MPAISRRLDDKNVDKPNMAGAVFAGRGEGWYRTDPRFLSATRVCAAVEFIGHGRGASGPASTTGLVSIGKYAGLVDPRSITNEGLSLIY